MPAADAKATAECKLRDEFLELDRSESAWERWKLAALGAVFAVAVTTFEHAGPYVAVLLAAPFVCLYCDLVALRWSVRRAELRRYFMSSDLFGSYERGATLGTGARARWLAVVVRNGASLVVCLGLPMVLLVDPHARESRVSWLLILACAVILLVVLLGEVLVFRIARNRETDRLWLNRDSTTGGG